MKQEGQKLVVFWFRRDLRIDDNVGLYEALNCGLPVLPLFIFDEAIVGELPVDDHRISFIYENLQSINTELNKKKAALHVYKGKVLSVWQQLTNSFHIHAVYTNNDYEPYAIVRDAEIAEFLKIKGIGFHAFKDQVIFEGPQIVKQDNLPYTVFTPYKNKWLENFTMPQPLKNTSQNYYPLQKDLPDLRDLGFTKSNIKVKPYDISQLNNYDQERNFPYLNATSYLGPHLRFGTVGIRTIVSKVYSNTAFLNELIWREFFMQILFHYPRVVAENFKSKYNNINWRNNTDEFERWKEGKTGYPLVDAGMRELNSTGFMHNRVRMVVAGFLCKHLLINWQWGEAYFADKLSDYELASNNGNWQWSAGTGCDAAPYFRIFNPVEQLKKYDTDFKYVRKWIPEWGTSAYPKPMVEHGFARERALKTYKEGMIS